MPEEERREKKRAKASDSRHKNTKGYTRRIDLATHGDPNITSKYKETLARLQTRKCGNVHYVLGNLMNDGTLADNERDYMITKISLVIVKRREHKNNLGHFSRNSKNESVLPTRSPFATKLYKSTGE